MQLERLRKLAETPNNPFLPSLVEKLIYQELRKIGLPEKDIASDKYALYTRIRRGTTRHPLVVATHLDHPGIVLKNAKEGIAFGSIGISRVNNIIATRGPLSLQIIDSRGNRGSATLLAIEPQASYLRRGTIPRAKIKAKDIIAPNSHALWPLPSFELQAKKIAMYNADNQAATEVLLGVLGKLLQPNSDVKNIDLTAIFTFVEEIHQISATAIARRKTTPFGPISKEHTIIVLEAMEANARPEIQSFIKQWSLPQPNYDDGPIIKINDDRIVFGQTFSQPNLAEAFLLLAARTTGEHHQHTLTSGSTEAKSFTLESTSEISPVWQSLVVINITGAPKGNLSQRR